MKVDLSNGKLEEIKKYSKINLDEITELDIYEEPVNIEKKSSMAFIYLVSYLTYYFSSMDYHL